MKVYEYVERQLHMGLGLSQKVVQDITLDKEWRYVTIHGKKLEEVEGSAVMGLEYSRSVASGNEAVVMGRPGIQRIGYIDDSRKTLYSLIHQFSSAKSEALSIIAEFMLVPNEKFLDEFQTDPVYIDSEAYMMLALPVEWGEFERVIRRAGAFVGFNAFVVSEWREELRLNPGVDLIDYLSKNCVIGVTGAYDFEGFILFYSKGVHLVRTAEAMSKTSDAAHE